MEIIPVMPFDCSRQSRKEAPQLPSPMWEWPWIVLDKCQYFISSYLHTSYYVVFEQNIGNSNHIYIINVVRLLFSLILLTIHLRPEITSTSRQRCIGPPSGSSQSSEIEKKTNWSRVFVGYSPKIVIWKLLGYIYNIYAHRYIYIYVCVYICIYILSIYISQFNNKLASEENFQKTSFEGWQLAVLGRVLGNTEWC